ncbi:MAG: sulfite exporter TauE/SafE family protein [Acidimicrobiia bacterium]|nr:sulfite exporter TauE/SafE family protein [Acidimicrobiia bacterium]
MDAGPLRDALTAVLGVFTGGLSGAFGVGGAVLSTPGIRLLGVSASLAVGTTLPSIFPSAVSGAWRYHREGLLDREAILLTVPTGLAASIVGALLTEVVPGDGHLLMLGTAALLAFTAVRMARPAAVPPEPEGDVEAIPDDAEPAGRSRLAFAGVGAVSGLLSGLLGIGGGVVMVPGFVQLAGLPIKAAVGTSLVCVGAFALPGTITHGVLGNIDWRVALFLTATVIPGARLGAALALRASDVALRRAVAIFLGLVSLVYAVGEVGALVS